MADRPNLLFVSPVMPAPTGNGLAMRAAMFLDALAPAFRVHLLIVPVAGTADGRRLPPFVRERMQAVVVDPLDRDPDPLRQVLGGGDPARNAAVLIAWPQPLACRFATPTRLARLTSAFPGVEFALVHVARLYMAAYAASFLEAMVGRPAPPAILDLDDDEPRTRERIARLHQLNGNDFEARLELREAERFAALERTWLGRFGHVLVCSPTDRNRLASRTDPARLAIVPNTVALPASTGLQPASAGRSGGRTILFVGTLGYLPNEDAACWFCREVLPAIRARADGEVRVQLVGANPGPRLQALRRLPGVELVGAVPDLEEHYRRSDLVVVPVRGGGGTRIKLLEALAHARPMVTTAVGAEGIAVEHGRHVLMADEPADFAAACLKVLHDPALARALAEQGRNLVAAHYAFATVAPPLLDLYLGACA
jgi:polysaccharide biosynthesis protein PslH